MKKLANPALQTLRQTLEDKFFYKAADFDGRTKILTIGEDHGGIRDNALCFEVYAGAPFVLFVASGAKATKALRQCAFDYALATETIGTVAFFDQEGEDFDTFRRRFRDSEFEAVKGIE
ncbi:MAG: hypothetical protein ACPG32_15035, partial [Akkermansiaceae bacterium]